MTDQVNTDRKEFESSDAYQQWAVAGMPADKQRLAFAMWQAALQSLRKRLAKAEPVCPHVVTGREGTSYCALAERGPAIAKAEPVAAEVRFKAVNKTLPGPWEFGQWQSANLASALKHPEPFVDDVGFLTEYRLLCTATPSISEAALREALPKPTYYMNGNPVWYIPEIVAALRSLGIEVGP